MEMSDTQTEPTGIQAAEKDSISTKPTPGPSSVDVVAIPANRALIYWNQAKRHIWPAIDTGEISPEKVIQNLAKGDMQLWIAWDDGVIGGAITEIVRYWKITSLRVIGLGGERFEDWHHPIDQLFEAFGKRYDCSRIELYGRKGWLRKLPNYQQTRIVMSRQIDGQR
jgi:hypothetical protein